MDNRRDTVAEAAEARHQRIGARNTITVNAIKDPLPGSGDDDGGDDAS